MSLASCWVFSLFLVSLQHIFRVHLIDLINTNSKRMELRIKDDKKGILVFIFNKSDSLKLSHKWGTHSKFLSICCGKLSWHVQLNFFPAYTEMIIGKIFPVISHAAKKCRCRSLLLTGTLSAWHLSQQFNQTDFSFQQGSFEPASTLVQDLSTHPVPPSLLLSRCANDARFPEPWYKPIVYEASDFSKHWTLFTQTF